MNFVGKVRSAGVTAWSWARADNNLKSCLAEVLLNKDSEGCRDVKLSVWELQVGQMQRLVNSTDNIDTK